MGISLDVPLDKAGAIGVAVIHVPSDIATKGRADLPEPALIRRRSIDQTGGKREHGRLGDGGGAFGTDHMGYEAVFASDVQDGRDRISGNPHVNVAPADGVKGGIPEPHCPVGPAVGRGPPVMDGAFGRGDLALHLGQGLGKGAVAGFGKTPRR